MTGGLKINWKHKHDSNRPSVELHEILKIHWGLYRSVDSFHTWLIDSGACLQSKSSVSFTFNQFLVIHQTIAFAWLRRFWITPAYFTLIVFVNLLNISLNTCVFQPACNVKRSENEVQVDVDYWKLYLWTANIDSAWKGFFVSMTSICLMICIDESIFVITLKRGGIL
jgi:hypothetical protein